VTSQREPPADVDPTVANYYQRVPKERRLRQGAALLEEARTRELIERLDEVHGAGFPDPQIFGIEGPGWLLLDVEERMSQPARREDLLNVARLVETEPTVVGASAHLLVVASLPA
jgi:hypothetical protein